MNSVYQDDSRYVLEPFYIDNGAVEFFDLGRKPIVRETFALGGSEKTFKGYEITDKCIQCGKCERICPQKCIKDFVINQTHLSALTKVLVMNKGDVEQYDTPAEILKNPATDFVAQIVYRQRHQCNLPDGQIGDCRYSLVAGLE